MFTPWSHTVALIYQQLTKTESLNGVCDAARVHASLWQSLRGAISPRRNTFSNANQNRDPAKIEVRGHMRQMVFFTNNLVWSAKTVEELYRARRVVKLFFMELKLP